MNLDFTPEYQAFRAEVRDFLETHKDSAPRMSDRACAVKKKSMAENSARTRLCRPHTAEGIWRPWRGTRRAEKPDYRRGVFARQNTRRHIGSGHQHACADPA